MNPLFEFWKMSGGGNDFIVLDGVTKPVPSLEHERIRRLCLRGVSIGADGLIVIAESSEADVRMIHWNADGGENDYCGNGTRCAARFAFERGLSGRSLSLATGAGVLRARMLENGDVSAEVPEPSGSAKRLSLGTAAHPAGRVKGEFVVVGVPHLVIEVDDVRSTDVASLGLALRSHPELGEAGANVDFVQRRSDGSLDIRTYERGVEGETLACGSGAVAAAISLGGLGESSGTVRLWTRSGIGLVVRFGSDESDGEPALWLEGDARIVYHGTTTAEADPAESTR